MDDSEEGAGAARRRSHLTTELDALTAVGRAEATPEEDVETCADDASTESPRTEGTETHDGQPDE